MPLNEATILNAKPSVKDTRLFDGKGLYLLVTQAGRKYWRFKYRFGGKERLLSMGVYPEVSLSDARVHRDEARQLLEKGVDPSVVRKEQKAREKAERLAAEGQPSVRVVMDGGVEIWKGRAVLRLDPEEAQFVKNMLMKLTS